MEKDLGKIPKNDETTIVVRIDDFGGKPGLTIREFVQSERYTGFTKSGTRIPAEHFEEFKGMINAISSDDLKSESQEKLLNDSSSDDSKPSNSGMDDTGLM